MALSGNIGQEFQVNLAFAPSAPWSAANINYNLSITNAVFTRLNGTTIAETQSLSINDVEANFNVHVKGTVVGTAVLQITGTTAWNPNPTTTSHNLTIASGGGTPSQMCAQTLGVSYNYNSVITIVDPDAVTPTFTYVQTLTVSPVPTLSSGNFHYSVNGGAEQVGTSLPATIVRNNAPCSLSATVRDAHGTTVCSLAVLGGAPTVTRFYESYNYMVKLVPYRDLAYQRHRAEVSYGLLRGTGGTVVVYPSGRMTPLEAGMSANAVEYSPSTAYGTAGYSTHLNTIVLPGKPALPNTIYSRLVWESQQAYSSFTVDSGVIVPNPPPVAPTPPAITGYSASSGGDPDPGSEYCGRYGYQYTRNLAVPLGYGNAQQLVNDSNTDGAAIAGYTINIPTFFNSMEPNGDAPPCSTVQTDKDRTALFNISYQSMHIVPSGASGGATPLHAATTGHTITIADNGDGTATITQSMNSPFAVGTDRATARLYYKFGSPPTIGVDPYVLHGGVTSSTTTTQTLYVAMSDGSSQSATITVVSCGPYTGTAPQGFTAYQYDCATSVTLTLTGTQIIGGLVNFFFNNIGAQTVQVTIRRQDTNAVIATHNIGPTSGVVGGFEYSDVNNNYVLTIVCATATNVGSQLEVGVSRYAGE